MSGRWKIIGGAGLQFFGKMTASISHEIKNAMTIINENAGLLEDLTLMAGKGMPLDPEKLNQLAGKVKKQICRMDGIIKNMNRFAHSADDPVKRVNIDEILALSVRLAARLANMKGLSLETRFEKQPIPLSTAPFLLENLVWLCLDYAMAHAADGENLCLSTKETSRGVHIHFSPIAKISESLQVSFPSDQTKALIDELQAELFIDIEDREIVLILPKET